MKLLATLLCAALTACAVHRPPPDPRILPIVPEIDVADAVFYGEAHDDRRQHDVELALLQSMTDGRPLLLGMEMFQRPFQAPLDDYVAGRIDEKEMLRRTEYFTRWSYDHTLYAPLWRWCRGHGVRIVALNCDGAITRKVGREGLSKLTPEERAQIAADVDLNVEAHRKRLMPAFEGGTGGPHHVTPERREMMYQAMTVWDETMADSAASALAAAGPGARMLIVAGRGHIEDLSGIPDRLAKRHPGIRRVVVVGDVDEHATGVSTSLDGDQWVVTFPAYEPPVAPKLSVQFDLEKPRQDGLLVQSIVPGGAAANAGVEAGDVIARFEGEPLRDLTDLRCLIDRRGVGDVVALTVLRRGEEISLPVTLAPAPPPTAKP